MNAQNIMRSILLGALLCMAMPLLAQSPDKEPPKPTWEMCDCCGSVNYQSNKKNNVVDMPNDLTASGLKRIYMQNSESYNYELTVSNIVPGKTQTASWYLIVIDGRLPAKAVITFEDNAGNDTTLTLIYINSSSFLKANNFMTDFGNVTIGDTVFRDLYLVNTNKNEKMVVENVEFYSEHSGMGKPIAFNMYDEDHNVYSFPRYIPQNDSMKVLLMFAPPYAGNFADSVTISTGGCSFVRFKMIGKGIAPLIKVDDVEFNVNKTSTSVSSIKITNGGKDELTISGKEGPFTPEFIFVDEFPQKISSKGTDSTTFDIYFRPSKEGVFSDSIIFHSNSLKKYVAGQDSLFADSICYLKGTYKKKTSVEDDADSFVIGQTEDGMLSIVLPSGAPSIANIEIYDVQGRTMLSAECVITVGARHAVPLNKIDISALPAGLYFVRCGAKFSKFVKI